MSAPAQSWPQRPKAEELAGAPNPKTARPRVLLVDDERLVLDGLAVRLRQKADVLTANSGAEAIAKLEAGPEVAVVVSDMRMPQMNGATLLKTVRERWPDTVRMLLTGYADLETAVAAVNEGNIFRFLTKPCPSSILLGALDAAVAQHRLVKSEKELLELTLKGAADMMSEVLELSNPAAFSAGRRIRSLAVAIAGELGLKDDVWVLELAALFGQLGAVTLSADTVQKLHLGADLTPDEQGMVAKAPEVADRLLSHIPRLEQVRDVVREARQPVSRLAFARILRVATDYFHSSSRGLVFSEAFAALDHDPSYDRQVLDALANLQGLARKASRVIEVGLLDLRPGMTLADDVVSGSGGLLLVKGHALSEHVLARLLNCARSGGVKEPIRVWAEEGNSATV